jgi:hypothetical protein
MGIRIKVGVRLTTQLRPIAPFARAPRPPQPAPNPRAAQTQMPAPSARTPPAKPLSHWPQHTTAGPWEHGKRLFCLSQGQVQGTLRLRASAASAARLAPRPKRRRFRGLSARPPSPLHAPQPHTPRRAAQLPTVGHAPFACRGLTPASVAPASCAPGHPITKLGLSPRVASFPRLAHAPRRPPVKGSVHRKHWGEDQGPEPRDQRERGPQPVKARVVSRSRPSPRAGKLLPTDDGKHSSCIQDSG